MGMLTHLIIAAAVAAPTVDAVTLQGQKHSGTLQALSNEEVTIQSGDKRATLPVRELMHVSFPQAASPKVDPKTTVGVTLLDGSYLVGTKFTISGGEAVVESPVLGTLKLPKASLAHVRFMADDTKFQAKWKDLYNRELRKDYVVVPRTNALDFLPVVVGDVTEEKVRFSFSGMPTTLPRNKPVYGVIFAHERSEETEPICGVELAGGGSVNVSTLQWTDSKLRARLLSGPDVEVPVDKLTRLDFSLGKIAYLSDLEPREVEFTPYFDTKYDRELFRYRRDRTYRNQKLQLGKTTYERGLWIHSRTRLLYRLNGEYRQFRAVMGIDQYVAKKGVGHVRVVISGDGKPLLETTVSAADPPQDVNLDVSNVRNLEILVDYGEGESTGDHLDLCDARLIK